MKTTLSNLLLIGVSITFLTTSCQKENLTTNTNYSGSRLKATSISRDNPTIAKDANGNSIIAWLDNRNGTNNFDIYAQKLDPTGQKLWTITDVRVNSDAGTSIQFFPSLAVDASGNAIIAWEDYRNGNNDVYAQKLSPGGTKLWTADVRVNSDNGKTSQTRPAVAVDASGNAIIAWLDQRGGSPIMAQKLGPNGNKLWTADASVTASGAFNCSIAIDGSGNAIIAWVNSTVEAQKLGPNGNKLWTEKVVGPVLTYYNPNNANVAVDISGNAIVSWEGEYGSNYGAYVQKLNANGDRLWSEEKSIGGVNPILADEANHHITVDASGNIIAVWEDFRDYSFFVITQKLDPNGNRLWGESDVLVSAIPNGAHPAVTADLTGNSIITWMSTSGSPNLNIFAQKLNPSAIKQWATNVQVNQ